MTIGVWKLCIAIAIGAPILTSCAIPARDPPVEEWIRLEFVVDQKFRLTLAVPPTEALVNRWPSGYVLSDLQEGTHLFSASYDLEQRWNPELLLTRIRVSTFRVAATANPSAGLTFEDIKREVYLSERNANWRYRFEGEQIFSGEPWMHIDLMGGIREGVSFVRPVIDRYALLVIMSVSGGDSSETRLYRRRVKTLEQVVETVQITTDFD